MVTISHVSSTIFDEWIPINYPKGFSKDNSFVFGIQAESQANAISIIKLNFERTHYLVHKITVDGVFNFLLYFIKIFNN